MGWLARYRHSCGFGVHSPFAFRFILEVIREKQSYYDYRRLSGKKQRLLYRVSAFFQPISIVSLGTADATAAKMAVGRRRHTMPPTWSGFGKATLAVADERAAVADIEREIANGSVVYLCKGSHKEIETLKQSMKHGMTFDNGHGYAIFVPFEKLPRQDFSVRF